jgi:hypothetical protein
MYIAHRINSSSLANSLPSEYGIEFDLREYNNGILVTHDPFTQGEDFESFLKNIKIKRFLIVNIKAEGIEEKVLDLLKKYEFENFFFLDCSFPAIVKLSKLGETRIAMRYSEYEPFSLIELNRNKIQWVWVDCFTEFPLTQLLERKIHLMGLKICIVSPELQSHGQDIEKYATFIKKNFIKVDTICTKDHNVPIWKRLLD